MMKVSSMADSVLAALRSAFFSVVRFFFLTGFLEALESRVRPTSCFGIIFALSGIRISGIADGLLFKWFTWAKEKLASLYPLPALDPSSGIILIEGASAFAEPSAESPRNHYICSHPYQ